MTRDSARRLGRPHPSLRVAAPLVVLAVAAASTLSTWSAPVRWSTDPDSLFFQAKVLKFRGHDERVALHQLFAGPKGSELRALEASHHPIHPQFTDSHWMDYSSRFFRRRLFVPLLAAGIYPVFGDRSLLTVSLLGYLLLSLAIYALLRRRFSPVTSSVVAAVCILSPALREHSLVPMSDSWSILLETCALLAAVLTLERTKRWLAAWTIVMVAASFTRDVTIVPLIAVLCLMLHRRWRWRSALLAVSGIAAMLPALLIYGNASVRENLAFVFNASNPPQDSSWGWVLHRYLPHLRLLLNEDLRYGTGLGWQAPLWYLGLSLAGVGAVLLIRLAARGDPFFMLHAYALIGAAAFVGIYDSFSLFRQELAFLPSVAVALALVTQQLEQRLPKLRTQARVLPGTSTRRALGSHRGVS